MAEQRRQHPLMVPLLAGLAGAGLALLFAPKSGKETRADISRRAAIAKEQAKTNLETAGSKVEQGIEHARQASSKLTRAIKRTETTPAS